MEKTTSVNGFINSLPRIPKRKIWNVVIDGQIVQGVSADGNLKANAERYIASKYPGKDFTLVFVGWKMGAPGKKG